jgi:hypothetical protein
MIFEAAIGVRMTGKRAQHDIYALTSVKHFSWATLAAALRGCPERRSVW